MTINCLSLNTIHQLPKRQFRIYNHFSLFAFHFSFFIFHSSPTYPAPSIRWLHFSLFTLHFSFFASYSSLFIFHFSLNCFSLFTHKDSHCNHFIISYFLHQEAIVFYTYFLILTRDRLMDSYHQAAQGFIVLTLWK